LCPVHDESLQLKLFHNSYGHQLVDDEHPIVWHEPILDDYWDRIEIGARRLLDSVTEICIGIENVEMKKERLAALVDIFRSGATNSIVDIAFDNTNLCDEGIISLSKLVDVSAELQYFSFDRNRIDDMESARCLSRSLKSHACIRQLSLEKCDLGASPEILLVILQSDVKWINLDNNSIDSLGAVTIAEYLEGNPPIHRIDLDHNRLNDDDAVLISQALKTNTNLETLYIQSNNFTSIGVKALLTCVFDSSSLNAISESNHTLDQLIMFSEQDSNDSSSYSFYSCINGLLYLGWTEKIIAALQDKDSLLKYLANIPVELIPEVLAFPRGQISNEFKHKHLNIVYSTMRWWNMPMLYSYHNWAKSDNTKRKRVN
jgi:hypothetical protein